MATQKTTTLTFRLEPNIKEALCIAADRDHRSIAHMVAVIIRKHCARRHTDSGQAVAAGTGSRQTKITQMT